jgi:hypothetical protein
MAAAVHQLDAALPENELITTLEEDELSIG